MVIREEGGCVVWCVRYRKTRQQIVRSKMLLRFALILQSTSIPENAMPSITIRFVRSFKEILNVQ